ncbi:MAG TPA: hypothetical protein VKE74_05485 [Gemmataceae bacterium]|nr:hypothetical protein [Gemmataceae bacterium]
MVRRSVTSFTTGEPSDAPSGLTATGPGEQPGDGDDVSRGVVLRGETIIDPGERVTVVGQLRVIDHPARIVNGMLVPGWVDVRVEGERVEEVED